MDLWIGNRYRIIDDADAYVMSHDELVESGKIEIIRDFAPAYGRNVRSGIVLGRTIISYSDRYIDANPKKAAELGAYREEWKKNPLQFFAPSGEGGIGYINDLSSKVCMMVAPNQCLTADTRIETPDGPEFIGNLYERGRAFRVWAWDGREAVPAWAEAPFRKPGLSPCFSVRTTTGAFCASEHHQILSGSTYSHLSDLLGSCQEVRTTCDHRSTGTGADSRASYSHGTRRCGGSPHAASAFALRSAPLSAGAYTHTHAWSYWGGLERTLTHILCGALSHRSTQDACRRIFGQALGLSRTGTSGHASASISRWLISLLRSGLPSPGFASLTQRVLEVRLGRSVSSQASGPPCVSADFHDALVASNQAGRKEVFDFTVPGYHNYVAAGVVHHNCGKSVSTLIKLLLSLVPCDKNWPIFAEHGVDWRPHIQELFGFASYKWEHIQEVIAPELLKWLPRYEMPDLVPEWRGGEGKRRSWDKQSTLMFPHGSGVRYHAYNQDQTSYESAALRGGWCWDEQPPEPRWEGANERIRTSRRAQHNHCLTPHRLEGMEDFTGAGTFLQRMFDGKDLKGYGNHAVRRYTIHRMNPEFDVTTYKEAKQILEALKAGELLCGGDVPDWVYPIQSRIEAYEQQIVNPLKEADTSAHAAGRSRVFGAFEHADELMVPEYNSKIHRIDPFPVPYANVSLYRYFDHGSKKPGAALWAFVPRPRWTCIINERPITFPDEPIVIFYREYYRPNTNIPDHARNVVLASGNRLVEAGQTGTGETMWREVIAKEKYLACKGDIGSLSKPYAEGKSTIRDEYRRCGLNMQETTRKFLHNRDKLGLIDIARSWFQVDYSRPHLFYPDTMGYTRVYFFTGLNHSHAELTNCIDPEFTKSKRQDDHLVQTCMYILNDHPRYSEGSSTILPDDNPLDKMRKKSQVRRDNYTGYPC